MPSRQRLKWLSLRCHPPAWDRRSRLHDTVRDSANVDPRRNLAARSGAPDDQKRNWSAVGIEPRLKGAVDRIGDELGDREFLVGSSLTLADISVVTALRIWGRGFGQDLPAKPMMRLLP
jgi:glutathione S-transferase